MNQKQLIEEMIVKINDTKLQTVGIINKVKVWFSIIKTNWQLFLSVLILGVVCGALIFGPISAGIQYLVDKYSDTGER